MRSNWEVWGYLGDHFGILEGPGTTLEFRWILGASLGPPLGEITGVFGGNELLQGPYYQLPNTSWLTSEQPLGEDTRLADSKMAEWIPEDS